MPRIFDDIEQSLLPRCGGRHLRVPTGRISALATSICGAGSRSMTPSNAGLAAPAAKDFCLFSHTLTTAIETPNKEVLPAGQARSEIYHQCNAIEAPNEGVLPAVPFLDPNILLMRTAQNRGGHDYEF